MKKRIIVACGGAVATSTVAANRVRKLCKAKGIEAEVSQYRITELESVKEKADLIITTAKVTKDYGVPVIHGIGYISGIGIGPLEEQILAVLTS